MAHPGSARAIPLQPRLREGLPLGKTSGRWTPSGSSGRGNGQPEVLRHACDDRVCRARVQHHEYNLGKTPAENIRHYKEDLKTLRGWLSAG